MVLDYNDAGYQVVRSMPLATLISPQFVRRRDDKTNSPSDVRIQQLGDRVEIAMIDKDARSIQRPVSQLLRRDVYAKESKGQTMIRKFVLWKTNKETDGDEYLGYVLHFTDYSPNRKIPLERELRTSNSISQILKLFEAMVAENIKSGWKEHARWSDEEKLAMLETTDEAPTTSAALVAS